jgi:NAD-dependent aldehyde dehydrogenases
MGNKLGPALLAGNTVVVNPAGTTPLTDLRTCEIIDKAIQDAGGPKGVLNVVTGPGSVVGEELLVNPTVRKIGFTGATGHRPAGYAIGRQGFQARDVGTRWQRSHDRLR